MTQYQCWSSRGNLYDARLIIFQANNIANSIVVATSGPPLCVKALLACTIVHFLSCYKFYKQILLRCANILPAEMYERSSAFGRFIMVSPHCKWPALTFTWSPLEVKQARPYLYQFALIFAQNVSTLFPTAYYLPLIFCRNHNTI